MINYFIYAKDYSGSTSHVPFYHDNGLETLKDFKHRIHKIKSELTNPEESRIIYLHWGHECVEVDEKTTIEVYKSRTANGNDTLPEKIIEWIKGNIDSECKIKLLYIITDGLIGYQSLNKCLELNENIDYENVVFHSFNQNLNAIDLSVALSFLKNRCTVYRNNDLVDDTDISEEFDYDMLTVDNFTMEKEKLKSYIKLKYINSSGSNASALAEIDKLKKLKNKLFKTLPQVNKPTIDLNIKDRNTFIDAFKNTDWYKSMSGPSYDLKIDIEKSITTAINYIISEKKSYAFDVLKFDTKFSNEVQEEPIIDVDFTPEQEIEFPDIILDDEKGIPVILCTEFNLLNKLIFHTSSVSSASFSKFSTIMDCPLFILNDPDLNDSIGYFYTLNVYKQLLEKTTRTEPRTRRPFHGGLVLVNTGEFDAYNDYILSATYFNSKKVNYNIGLFYFILWKICETKQWMDKNILDQLKTYMLRRVRNTMCKIGLTSLALDPKMNTSLPTALWYCVELSSYIFKDDPQRFTHERLRMYYGVAHAMIEILQYLEYNLDLEYIEKRKDLIRHVMILKKIPTHREKVYYMLEKIFKKVNGFLVSEIENQVNIKKLNYLKLNHRGMLSDDIINGKIDLNDYIHLMYQIGRSDILICEKTFRPLFITGQNESFYSELCKISKKVLISNVDGETIVNYGAIDNLEFSKILSLYNLFLNSVKDCNKFPTLEEYAEYVLRKKKFKDGLITVFQIDSYERIENVFLTYASITKDIDVNEFIKVSNKYVNRVERIKAENKTKFLSDKEIHEFIYKEECEVKLVKVKT